MIKFKQHIIAQVNNVCVLKKINFIKHIKRFTTSIRIRWKHYSDFKHIFHILHNFTPNCLYTCKRVIFSLILVTLFVVSSWYILIVWTHLINHIFRCRDINFILSFKICIFVRVCIYRNVRKRNTQPVFHVMLWSWFSFLVSTHI